MDDRKYKVMIDQCEPVARGMNIETATILVKALFEKHPKKHCMSISIQEDEHYAAVAFACESA